MKKYNLFLALNLFLANIIFGQSRTSPNIAAKPGETHGNNSSNTNSPKEAYKSNKMLYRALENLEKGVEPKQNLKSTAFLNQKTATVQAKNTPNLKIDSHKQVNKLGDKSLTQNADNKTVITSNEPTNVKMKPPVNTGINTLNLRLKKRYECVVFNNITALDKFGNSFGQFDLSAIKNLNKNSHIAIPLNYSSSSNIDYLYIQIKWDIGGCNNETITLAKENKQIYPSDIWEIDLNKPMEEDKPNVVNNPKKTGSEIKTTTKN